MPETEPVASRPRQPTVVLMEEMEEVWKQVFALESEGKADEAAEHQNTAMVEVKKRYNSNKLAMDAWAHGKPLDADEDHDEHGI